MRDTKTAFVGSLAMIRRYVGDVEEWLTVWDEDREAFRLIEAAREKPDSFRSCLDEVIEDELGLSRKRDYLISGLSRAHHQAPIEWPGTHQPQWVVVEFFPVDLYGKRAAPLIAELEHVRWLPLAAVAQGTCADGRPFCPWQHTLINRADVLPVQLRSHS